MRAMRLLILFGGTIHAVQSMFANALLRDEPPFRFLERGELTYVSTRHRPVRRFYSWEEDGQAVATKAKSELLSLGFVDMNGVWVRKRQRGEDMVYIKA